MILPDNVTTCRSVTQPLEQRSDTAARNAGQIFFMASWPEAGLRLPVGGVFQALFLDLGGILPNEGARARVNQLKIVKHVIARARAGPGAQSLQRAGQEKIRALEFHDVGI